MSVCYCVTVFLPLWQSLRCRPTKKLILERFSSIKVKRVWAECAALVWAQHADGNSEETLLSTWSSLGNSCVSLMTRTPHGDDALITSSARYVRDAIRWHGDFDPCSRRCRQWQRTPEFKTWLSFAVFHKKSDFSVSERHIWVQWFCHQCRNLYVFLNEGKRVQERFAGSEQNLNLNYFLSVSYTNIILSFKMKP